MNHISIVNRALTSEETELVNKGFDKLSLEEGIALESTERISFVAMNENTLIGCASGLAHKNGERYSGWFHLTDLYVAKEFRNQGLGFDGIRRRTKRFSNSKYLALDFWSSNIKVLQQARLQPVRSNGTMVF